MYILYNYIRLCYTNIQTWLSEHGVHPPNALFVENCNKPLGIFELPYFRQTHILIQRSIFGGPQKKGELWWFFIYSKQRKDETIYPSLGLRIFGVKQIVFFISHHAFIYHWYPHILTQLCKSCSTATLSGRDGTKALVS